MAAFGGPETPKSLPGPGDARLIVSVTGVAAMAPSASGSATRVATTPSSSAGVISGLAASWIATNSVSTAANALETDWVRVAPPSTTSRSFPSRSWAWPDGQATTIERTLCAARIAAIDHSTIGWPANGTKAFGPPAPSLSPEPAAAMTAVTEAAVLLGGDCGGEALLQQPVEVFLRALLVFVKRVHELRGEDLLRPRVHLLLAGGETLLHLAQGEVADDLGELEDIAGLDLLAVVLEAPVPVLRHVRDVIGEDACDLFDFDLVDDPPQTCPAGIFARDHHGEFVVEDLDREVFTLLPHQLPRFFLHHQAGAMMRIDDLVALLEVEDILDFLDAYLGGLL